MTAPAPVHHQPHPVRTWASVAGLLCAATAGSFLLEHRVSLTSQAMLYVLAVVVAAYTMSLLPSIICALGAVTAFNFFFVPPRWTFEVDSQEHLIALFTMLVVALVINHLAAALRKKTDLARLSAQRAHQLQTLAGELANVTRADDVMQLGQNTLNTIFPGPSWVGLRQPDGTVTGTAPLTQSVRDGLQCCLREAAVLGPGTGRWPGLNAWYLPLGTHDRMNGAVCIEQVQASDTDNLEHAQALCTLLAQALWRIELMDATLTAQAETQRQQVQSTFLAAVSHDLRTPLATIVGATSALQTQGDKLNTAEKVGLLDSIASEAAYLTRLTENTLQLVQLTNAAQTRQWQWESIEEIVGAALTRWRQQDPTRRIRAKVPEGLPLLRADPVLLTQLIGNLLDNALKYSSGPIDLNVALIGGELQIAVKDRGAVIAAEDQQRIFEPYSRSDQSGQRGAGLGLALCRAIAKVHGGQLTLRRRHGGGNSFVLSLPVDQHQPEGDQP